MRAREREKEKVVWIQDMEKEYDKKRWNRIREKS